MMEKRPTAIVRGQVDETVKQSAAIVCGQVGEMVKQKR